MEALKLALNAMNTRFELVLPEGDVVALRAAGEEALHEIERIEGLLSAFRTTSEISAVNARAGTEPVQVSPEVFALLVQARALSELTEGAFDITVGPLMRCWGFWGRSGRKPDASDVESALDSVGIGHLELDSNHRTVRFGREKMSVDLGAIGKGYAIGQAVEILGQSGVCRALLHGGTSTTYAIGAPPDQPVWRTAIDTSALASVAGAPSLPVVEISNEALSVSAVSEKSFTADGVTYGHVIDPRNGWPVRRTVLSVVTLPDAAEADALSTALMVTGATGLMRLRRLRPGLRGLIVDGQGAVTTAGMEPGPPIVK